MPFQNFPKPARDNGGSFFDQLVENVRANNALWQRFMEAGHTDFLFHLKRRKGLQPC